MDSNDTILLQHILALASDNYGRIPEPTLTLLAPLQEDQDSFLRVTAELAQMLVCAPLYAHPDCAKSVPEPLTEGYIKFRQVALLEDLLKQLEGVKQGRSMRVIIERCMYDLKFGQFDDTKS